MVQEKSLTGKVRHRPAGVKRKLGLAKADLGVILVAFIVELGSFFPATAGSLSGALALVAFVYVACGFIALPWRHRAPMMIFAGLLLHQSLFVLIFTANYFTYSDLFMAPYMPVTAAIVALAAVASDLPLRQSLAAFAVSIALPLLVTSRGRPFEEDLWFIFSGIMWMGGAWAFGRFVARNRVRIRALQDEQRKAEAAVAHERAHIAAELHDIVSHAVTVMMLHAAGGRKVVESDPKRAAQALEVIESVGTEATQELARLLRLLKPAGEKKDEVQQSPLPTLSDIDSLVEPVRSAGVQVDVKASGQTGKLDPSVGNAAYRVVQESLTNISKHAGSGTNALIELRWEPQSLTLNISDDGAGKHESQHDNSTGYGLLGLKERVQVAGGTIEWGPKDRGFFLIARLPLSL